MSAMFCAYGENFNLNSILCPDMKLWCQSILRHSHIIDERDILTTARSRFWDDQTVFALDKLVPLFSNFGSVLYVCRREKCPLGRTRRAVARKKP